MSNASVRRLLKLGRGGHDGGIVWLERARACFAAGRSAEGREAARRALAESPRDTSLLLAVADLLEQAGLGGDAMAIHRALVALPSPPGAAVIRVAEELLAQSQEEPALALLGRQKMNPGNRRQFMGRERATAVKQSVVGHRVACKSSISEGKTPT